MRSDCCRIMLSSYLSFTINLHTVRSSCLAEKQVVYHTYAMKNLQILSALAHDSFPAERDGPKNQVQQPWGMAYVTMHNITSTQ